MRGRYAQYKIVKPYNSDTIYDVHIAPEFRSILTKFITVGGIISSKTIQEQLVQESSTENLQKTSLISKISKSLKIGLSIGVLKEFDDGRHVPEWFKQLDSVSYWQSQLRSSRNKNLKKSKDGTTQYIYLQHLWKFNRWLTGKTFRIDSFEKISDNTFTKSQSLIRFKSVEQLIEYLENPLNNPKSIIKIIKEYLLDSIHDGKKASYVTNIKFIIISYFEKNEYEIKLKFNPGIKYDEESTDDVLFSLSDFVDITRKTTILEKSVLLGKLQRGLDSSTFADRFNFEVWDQLVKWFGTENYDSWDCDKCPVPIILTRIKTGFRHTGCVDRDYIESLQKYLKFRETKTNFKMKSGQPLYLNKHLQPITKRWISNLFSRLCKNNGIASAIGSHELRDLLKSTLIECGCRIDIADHVIGHMPKDSYEKQAKLYPETVRSEFAKASKRLNIFSKFANVVSGIDDSDELRIELKEKMLEMEKFKEEMVMERAVKKQEEIFSQRQYEMMADMQRQIDEMKSGNTITQKNTEFCCISCSTVHDLQQCPACGSKLKRIYEEKNTHLISKK